MYDIALFRLESTLVRPNALQAAAWLAARSKTLGGRLARLAGIGLSLPLRVADPAAAVYAAYKTLDGLSEDRLVLLGEAYANTLELTEVGHGLLAHGGRIVLVSEHVDAVVRPFARRHGIEEWLCNRLVVRDGRVTGQIEEPVVAGHSAGRRVREWAKQQGISLDRVRGYGSGHIDTSLLTAVGRPCAVAPDSSLRHLARDLDWPIVEAA